MALSKFERARRQSIEAHRQRMEWYGAEVDSPRFINCGFCDLYNSDGINYPFDDECCTDCPVRQACMDYLNETGLDNAFSDHMAALLYLFDLKENTNGNA